MVKFVEFQKYMPRNRISTADKQHIIEAHANGEDYVETARLLGVKRTTAWGIVRRHQLRGQVDRPRGGPWNVKVDQEMIDNMIASIEGHPEFTLARINENLRAALPDKPHITNSTISKILRGQLIMLKKMETVLQDGNREDILQARRQYGTWLLNVVNGINPRELIFVDESGFNLWIARTRGRAVRGQRAVRVVGGSRGPNFTLILAVSNRRGMIHHEFFQGGINADRFNAWLRDASAAAGDGPVTFVFDNAPCHRRYLEADLQDNHEGKTLPAYSPFLNISENCFSVWKAAFKRQMAEVRPQLQQQAQAQRHATLLQIGAQNLDAITAANCVKSFRKTTTYIPAMVQMLAINDHQ